MVIKTQRDMDSYTNPYGYIYMFRNKTNDKKYIGLTTDRRGIRCRWSLNILLHKYYYNNHLCNSLRKYGIENFEYKIIDSGKDKKHLDELEIFYIQTYNTINSKFGYNLRYGGSRGKNTKETRKKISKAGKKRYKNPIEREKTSEAIKKSWKKRNINSNRNFFLYQDKWYLFFSYYVDKKTLKQIAEECNVYLSTIQRWMFKLNIPIMNNSKAHKLYYKKIIRKYKNKNWLYDQYWILKKSTIKIAEECNVSNTPIKKWMKRFNIPRRSNSEAQKLRHKQQKESNNKQHD